jgi:hypothetical protein
LSALTRGIIEQQQPRRVNEYVFPASKGRGPFNAFSVLVKKLDEKLPASMRD